MAQLYYKRYLFSKKRERLAKTKKVFYLCTPQNMYNNK